MRFEDFLKRAYSLNDRCKVCLVPKVIQHIGRSLSRGDRHVVVIGEHAEIPDNAIAWELWTVDTMHDFPYFAFGMEEAPRLITNG